MHVIQQKLVATHGNVSPWTMKVQRDCRQNLWCIMHGENSIYSLSRRLHANSNHVNECVASRHSSHMCENIPVSFFGNEVVFNSAQVHTLTWTGHLLELCSFPHICNLVILQERGNKTFTYSYMPSLHTF